MTSPGLGLVRHARAAVVAATAVMLSVAGHVVGGGHSPHPVTMSVLVLVAMIPVYVLGRRQLGLPALLVLLGGAQVGVHHLLSLPSPLPHAGHHAASPGMSMGGGSHPVAMTLGHAVATVVLAVLLAHGDSALWRLWWLVSSAWRSIDLVVVRPTKPVRRPVPSYRRPAASRWLAAPSVPRGPPALAV